MDQLFDLQGRVAVVTGASGGFGAESARTLAEAGAKVVLVGRDNTRLRPLTEELRGSAAIVEGDVSKEGEADRIVCTVVSDHGKLDILINAAGSATVGGLMDLDDETWQADIDLKLLGYIRMMHAAARVMQEQGGGRIVNIIGLAGHDVARAVREVGSRIKFWGGSGSIDAIEQPCGQTAKKEEGKRWP